MKLLAIILAFGMFQYIEKPKSWCLFQWLNDLKKWLSQWLNENTVLNIVTVLIPLLLCSIILSIFDDFSSNVVGYLVIHVVVIYYCLGPHTIVGMIDNKKIKEQLKLTENAEPEEIVYKLTDAALHRWFGVFFWYVVFNIYGALLYRIICHLASSEDAEGEIKYMLKLIEFPVTVIMTVSLAMASDFDKIWKYCKQYLNTETIKQLNSQYMYKSMDFAVEQCEIEENDENKAHIVELTTYKVLKRMLVVWLVFSALMVLFSIG